MARFELGDRFWTIGRDGPEGTTLITTSGKVGNQGRLHKRTYPTPGAASSRYDELVLEKQRAGYQLVGPPAPAAAAPAIDAAAVALEAAIVADPTDDAAYAVYADWLQQQGDPRGELINLMLAREAEVARDPKRRSQLPAAISRLMERHAPTLLGPLAAYMPDVRDLSSGMLTWRAGFLHRLTIKDHGGAAAIVRDVISHPSGRYLRELMLDLLSVDEAHAVIDVLCDRAPATLGVLELIVHDTKDGARLDATALWAAVPALRRINLAAQQFDLGAVRAPAAERARFATRRLSVADVRAIAVAPWPALQRLELRFGGRYDASSSTIDDLQPLLGRDDLPALTHLKLRGCSYAGEALVALAQGPLARQLVVIDLSHGHVEREDLRALVRYRTQFPALRELWLPSFVTAEAIRTLGGIATHMISDERAALDVFL